MRVIAFVAALALAGCAEHYDEAGKWVAAQPLPPPAPNSIAAQMAGEWSHEPPVSGPRLDHDKAHCKTVAAMAPASSGTPEITFNVTYLNCLKSMGYKPIPVR